MIMKEIIWMIYVENGKNTRILLICMMWIQEIMIMKKTIWKLSKSILNPSIDNVFYADLE